MHRCGTIDKPRSQNGWYVLHLDPSAGAFGDWRSGETRKWTSKNGSGLTLAERTLFKKRLEEAQKEREQEERKRHELAKERAGKILLRCKPARADHPYLIKKAVKPIGDVKTMKSLLVLPVVDVTGEVASLQFASPDGKKRFLSGGKIQGGFFPMNGADGPLFICEGYANGATTHEATGGTVLCAFSAGNLEAVARMARRRGLIRAIKRASWDPSYLSSVSGGGPVEEFEEAFASATGGKYALALSSCTAALHTALMAIGIGPGDEVIVSPYAWGQSVAPVLFIGGTAVFSDIDPNTLTFAPQSVAERISSKTRAMIPVHIFGNPADMDALSAIAENRGIAVISDAAQAFRALSKSRKIGSLGHAACFSFGPGKAVFGGEGGVLVTNDRALYEKAVALSQHPLRAFREVISSEFACMDELSWNYRIHPLAAVLALADLEVAPQRVAERRQALESAHKAIRDIPGLEPVRCYPGDLSAAYRIPLTFDTERAGSISREGFIEALHKQGITLEAGPVRIPIQRRRAFQEGKTAWGQIASHFSHLKGSCPVAERRCEYAEVVASLISL